MKENMADYDTEDSFPLLMSICSKYLRENLNRKLKKSGSKVTSEQWSVLIVLLKSNGLSQQEIADRFKISKVAVFRLIGRLEEHGFVERCKDPSDGRCNRVYITSEGRKLIPSVIPMAEDNKKKAAAGISDEELAVLKKTMKKMIDNLKG